MAISASSISHAIQTVAHRHNDHPSAPIQRRQTFQQQLTQAAGKAGSAGAAAAQPATSGGFLSADLLKAIQGIE